MKDLVEVVIGVFVGSSDGVIVESEGQRVFVGISGLTEELEVEGSFDVVGFTVELGEVLVVSEG